MPYADNLGTRIHYQILGDGPPLVLLHGIFASLGDWYDGGFAWALKRDYTLILVDARGHGASDKPHNPDAYGLIPLSDDIIAVLDHLQIQKAHFLGYSWGACIGYGLALRAPNRFHSIVAGGLMPEGSPDFPDWIVPILQSGVEAFAKALDDLFPPALSSFNIRRLSGDFDAYIAAVQGFAAIPNLIDLFRENTVPLLLFMGENEDDFPRLQQAAQQISNATLTSFPGLDHISAMTASETIVPELRRFLSQTRATG